MPSRIARFIFHYSSKKGKLRLLAIQAEEVVVGFSAGGWAGGGVVGREDYWGGGGFCCSWIPWSSRRRQLRG